jgi:histidine triad (HIT) family protein
MPDNYLSEILLFAQPIASAIEKSFSCKRCGLSVVGLEVPHAHLHLIPLNTMDDINFTRKKLSLTPEQLKKAQEKILNALES